MGSDMLKIHFRGGGRVAMKLGTPLIWHHNKIALKKKCVV